MKNNVPCYGCTKRKVGCHASCENYLSFRANHDVEKASIQEKKILESTMRGIAINRMRQSMKKSKLPSY